MTIPRNNNNDDKKVDHAIRKIVMEILDTPIEWFDEHPNRCSRCNKKGSLDEIANNGWVSSNNELGGHILFCPKCYKICDQLYGRSSNINKEEAIKTLKEGYEYLHRCKFEKAAQRNDFVGEMARAYLEYKFGYKGRKQE